MGVLAVAYDPASAAVVRRCIAADLAALELGPDELADVLLVASELVGNAVRHARAPCGELLDVSWDLEPDAVVVRVLDASAELPRQQESARNATRGRGLAIVAALALDWGVRRFDRGKQVWARVPVHKHARSETSGPRPNR